jgi:hypothetical protein
MRSLIRRFKNWKRRRAFNRLLPKYQNIMIEMGLDPDTIEERERKVNWFNRA